MPAIERDYKIDEFGLFAAALRLSRQLLYSPYNHVDAYGINLTEQKPGFGRELDIWVVGEEQRNSQDVRLADEDKFGKLQKVLAYSLEHKGFSVFRTEAYTPLPLNPEILQSLSYRMFQKVDGGRKTALAEFVIDPIVMGDLPQQQEIISKFLELVKNNPPFADGEQERVVLIPERVGGLGDGHFILRAYMVTKDADVSSLQYRVFNPLNDECGKRQKDAHSCGVHIHEIAYHLIEHGFERGAQMLADPEFSDAPIAGAHPTIRGIAKQHGGVKTPAELYEHNPALASQLQKVVTSADVDHSAAKVGHSAEDKFRLNSCFELLKRFSDLDRKIKSQEKLDESAVDEGAVSAVDENLVKERLGIAHRLIELEYIKGYKVAPKTGEGIVTDECLIRQLSEHVSQLSPKYFDLSDSTQAKQLNRRARKIISSDKELRALQKKRLLFGGIGLTGRERFKSFFIKLFCTEEEINSKLLQLDSAIEKETIRKRKLQRKVGIVAGKGGNVQVGEVIDMKLIPSAENIKRMVGVVANANGAANDIKKGMMLRHPTSVPVDDQKKRTKMVVRV
ncbi:MAG: hypothetical protein LBS76_02205 [Mycoplasmataceae bacterium]|jgi:hypothetical protein|nr:hypothetical protein [Mycoplasmataceae bacterium]